uniref:Translation initiation factor IF-2-like n=1 Tax=Drosophila rhopaloa TaxID=1041015 RepID=A0A6P4G3L1_DRORH
MCPSPNRSPTPAPAPVLPSASVNPVPARVPLRSASPAPAHVPSLTAAIPAHAIDLHRLTTSRVRAHAPVRPRPKMETPLRIAITRAWTIRLVSCPINFKTLDFRLLL